MDFHFSGSCIADTDTVPEGTHLPAGAASATLPAGGMFYAQIHRRRDRSGFALTWSYYPAHGEWVEKGPVEPFPIPEGGDIALTLADAVCRAERVCAEHHATELAEWRGDRDDS